MAQCRNCQATIDDSAATCPYCNAVQGAPVPPQNFQPMQGQPMQGQAPYQQQYVPMVSPHDHTADFDAKDISDNKAVAVLVYLLSVVGIIMAALIGGNSSKFVSFHIRQSLKFLVTELLMGIALGVVSIIALIPIIGWIIGAVVGFAAGIMYIVLFVIKIICVFQILGGKACEPAIIRDLKFLK